MAIFEKINNFDRESDVSQHEIIALKEGCSSNTE